MHDLHGLSLDRIPDVIANTVALIVDQLQSQALAQKQINGPKPMPPLK